MLCVMLKTFQLEPEGLKVTLMLANERFHLKQPVSWL